MTILKTPALPRDVLRKGEQSNSDILTKTAKAIEQVPQVSQGGGQQADNPAHKEATAAVMYLADVITRLLDKIAELRDLPLDDFKARMDAYIGETAAALPEQARKMFLSRAEVYATATAADIQAREEAVAQSVNSKAFSRLLEGLEASAMLSVSLPEGVQTQVMATALADYKHALEGGEAAGLLVQGSGALMLAELQQDMALAAAKNNIATAKEPTFLALLIASGETGLPDVDNLPADTRMDLLHQTLTSSAKTQQEAS